MEQEFSRYKRDNLKTWDVKNPTGTLMFLRVLAMIAKVLSMIAFVGAIALCVFCFVEGISIINNKDMFIEGAQTLETYIANVYGTSVYTLSFVLLSAALLWAGVIPLAWFSWRYFGWIFRNKTPFTHKTFRDGVRMAIIAGGIEIISVIAYGILIVGYRELYGDSFQYVNCWVFSHISYGVIILILSFINRHGAQLRDANEQYKKALMEKYKLVKK